MAFEYFEDYEIGAHFETKARTVTETDIVNFVNLFGFHESLFMDMNYVAEESLFDRRISPGSFTFALAEGLTVQSGMVKGGMALIGIDGMKMLAPLPCGATVHVKVEILDKRKTSKPDRGIVTSLTQLIDHGGAVLLEYTVKRMIRRKQK